jgi:hypothetical protein
VKDRTVEALDDAREGRGGKLPTILAGMIRHACAATPDEIIEIRGTVYVNVAKMIQQNVPSIDLAKQLPKIVHDRIVDHYRRLKRKADPEREVSIEDLPYWKEPADRVDVEQLVIGAETICEARNVLAELRESENEVEQRTYVILDAFMSRAWTPDHIPEIMGKQISQTNASTLLLRAKQRFRDRLATAGKGVKYEG